MTLYNMSIAASMVILAAMGLRALLMHRLPKRTFLALWAVVLSRLFIPFSIPSRFNITSIINAFGATWPQEAQLAATELPQVTAPVTAPLAEMATEAATLAQLPIVDAVAPGVSLLFWLWLAGAVACALYFITTHTLFCNLYKVALPVEGRFVKDWLTLHPLRRGIRVRQTDIITSPLTYGLLRPIILLPKSWNGQDEQQLSYILTHEYVHIRRLDILWKYLLAAALCIHWFNPLVWAMYTLANRDLELSCDESVLRILGEENRSAYARTLISLVTKRKIPALLCSNFGEKVVEKRIVSIMKIKRFTSSSVIASSVLVAFVAILFATSAAPAAATPIAAIAPDLLDTQPSVKLSSETLSPEKTVAAIGTLANMENFTGKNYTMRMLFFSKGETELKVTYDGKTWEPSSSQLSDEPWYWWGYEEYQAYSEALLQEYVASRNVTQEVLDAKTAHYMQTLKDIKNGMKVSKIKQIFALNPGPKFGPTGGHRNSIVYDGIILWYCFGYTVTDAAGNDVDLGIFETRDQLFAALKQYYDAEVAAGNLTQTEADGLYNAVAHSVRNADEVPLAEKLLNYNTYVDYTLMLY